MKPPERCSVAVLCIDVINDLEFPGADKLLPHALRMAKRVAPMLARARRAGVAVIFANDNFGHWRSDFRAQVKHVLEQDVRGRPVAELLRPTEDDYFVLKPKHSAFFSTALETLLQTLGARTLVMVGLAGDSCVLFSAHDAYMRDYDLVVPSDGIASESVASNRWALAHMKKFLKIAAPTAARVDFPALVRATRRGKGNATSTRGVTRAK